MTIEVTGCHDCPFMEMGFCTLLKVLVNRFIAEDLYPPSCPLKQGEITIKLKSDETNN